MAISGIGSGASGHRRSLDAEVNLVPFIDLLSMCICFLLMTAVWTQLGSVQVKQAMGTDAAPPSKALDLEVKILSAQEVTFGVKSGKTAKLSKSTIQDFDRNVKELVASMAKQGQSVGSVMVTPHISADYGVLVSVMDKLRSNSLQNIGVVPAKVEGVSP